MEKFLYSRKLNKTPKMNVWFAYPAIESFAMASLGYLYIYKLLDDIEDIFVERVYQDSKTTRLSAKDVKIIGFSTSFEIDILNVIKMLKKYEIPLKATDRGENDPLIFAGGPVIMANPLPYAEFYDFLCIGEGQLLPEVVQFVADNQNLKRSELLAALSKFKGIWVPNLGKYEVEIVRDNMVEPVFTTILSEKSFFSDTFVIELERGCPKMCNFCLASWLNLPTRFIEKEKIIKAIQYALNYTNKIALLGAYVAGHPDFGEIINFIKQKNEISPIELSISSLRADLADLELYKALYACGQKHATIAIEAGSERMRKIIKKDLSNEQIFKTVEAARLSGLCGVKIYTMIGFPYEKDEDIEALIEIARELKAKNKGFDITFSLSTLIPKANTPFEGVEKETPKSLEKKINYLKKQMHKIGVTFRTSSVEWDSVQAILSRADISLFDYLVEVEEKGGNLGAFKHTWKDFYKSGVFKKSYEQAAIMPFDCEKEVPWGFIKTVGHELLDKRKLEFRSLKS